MKYFIIILLAVASVILYLNRAYSHIFSFLNANNPSNPTTHMTFIIKSPTKTSSSLTYVAVGDSLTAGVGAQKETESYPYRLSELLAKKNNTEVTLVNLGVPGATAADVLNQQVLQVAALHPDIVTLLIGVNDLHNRVPAETFKKNITSIIDGLSGSTKHLNVITIPYLGNSSAFWPPYRAYYDRQTRDYNNLLREALSDRDVTLIDLYSLTHERAQSDADYYSPDGFHPSASTYDYWSQIIYDHLN